MRTITILTSLLLMANSAQLLARAASNQSAKPSAQACSEPQQRQFDFWVGEWELTWPGQKPGESGHGTNRITRILDGCVIQESFSGGVSMPLRGNSVSVFDARAGKWKQTWVDNQGGYLDFVGEFKDGQMILSRAAKKPDGTPILQRMVWRNIANDTLDWSWERSQDGGQTWQVLWPIHYQRRK